MKGYSQSIGNRPYPYITIHGNEYTIDWDKYQMTTTEAELGHFTEGVLAVFRELQKASRKSVTLDKGFCKVQLDELAKWGKRAYHSFFLDKKPREDLNRCFWQAKELPTPTFTSEKFLFPWEVLYEERVDSVGSDGFWGVQYAPARILFPNERFPPEHALPLDMIFCLYDQLKAAHQLERPALERWFGTGLGRFRLLGPILEPIKVCDGVSLLRYLDQGPHNMIHFACHCKLNEGVDSLLLSLIDETKLAQEATSIELNTYHFLDHVATFQRQPLVFLNACESGGGTTALRQTFNLPRKFIKRKAAAVIATACPVPDLFAAEFAKHFYKLFLGGQEEVKDEKGQVVGRVPIRIGEALRLTRRYFLEEHNNPLGLAYGLYSPAYYRLAQIPAHVGG